MRLQCSATGSRDRKKKAFSFVARSLETLLTWHGRTSVNLQGIQHGLDARHLVSAKEICFPQSGQHGKERLGTADLFAEILEGMRQRIADREAQRTQAKCAQKHPHLMAHTHSAVLKVAII